MRTNRTAIGMGLVGIALVAGSMLGFGCSNLAEDCEERRRPCDGASGTSGGGQGGSGGSTPPGCVPSMNADPVGDGCGVFVGGAAANDTNAGTKDAPLATLGAAITAAAAKGSRVYACAQEFAEAIEVPAGIEVYGGLDCATDWRYVEGQKTTIAPAADRVPVTLLAGEGARLEDVAAVAADATVAGGSSIAVITQDGVTAELLRCELRAGAGAAGAPGMTPTEVGPNGEGQNGEPGVTGVDEGMGCTTMAASLGGGGGQRMCDRMSVSGGRGGSGTPDDSGGAGSPGQGQPGTPPLDGAGGKAQDAMACGQGNAGAEGTPGLAGSGAAGIGDLSATGYTAMSGSAGMSTGTPGQGGGGGGGAKKCGVGTMFAGPSGGGGGSGGCGGAPGLGGGAGGSSIGLLSHQATVTLTSSSIATALGGAGGLGGNGQPGGFGGQPGPAGGMGGACPGGIGGSGGRGGSGGGGLGGHSLGIAFKGTAPVQTDVTIMQGAQGPGGLGGDGDVTVQGADGQACKTLSFDEPESCM